MGFKDLYLAVAMFFDAAILAHGGIVGRPLLAAAKAVALRELSAISARLASYIACGQAMAALNTIRELLKGKLDADVPHWLRSTFDLDERLDKAFAWLIAEQPHVLEHLGAVQTLAPTK